MQELPNPSLSKPGLRADGTPCVVLWRIWRYNFTITGCEVYAHDHTIKAIPHTRYDNIHFVLTGLGSENVNGSRVKTLDAILGDNGHTDAVINYLKVPRSRRLL